MSHGALTVAILAALGAGPYDNAGLPAGGQYGAPSAGVTYRSGPSPTYQANGMPATGGYGYNATAAPSHGGAIQHYGGTVQHYGGATPNYGGTTTNAAPYYPNPSANVQYGMGPAPYVGSAPGGMHYGAADYAAGGYGAAVGYGGYGYSNPSGGFIGGHFGLAGEPMFRYDAQEPWLHGYFQEIPAYGGHHAFRPYNYKQLLAQSQAAAGWGLSATMPYSQQFWHRYEEKAKMLKPPSSRDLTDTVYIPSGSIPPGSIRNAAVIQAVPPAPAPAVGQPRLPQAGPAAGPLMIPAAHPAVR